MKNVTVSMKNKIFLIILLFLLNVVIRIPSIPHEKGIDSFFLHLLAESLSLYGEPRWWINTYSIFGFFPFSYPSSAPFSLSGIEQVASVNMEHSILIYCVLLGLFSMLSMYLFAGVLYDNFLFKYIASMIFSLSQGVLLFTTWEVGERGVFFIFLPVFIYLILKDNISNLKKGFLGLILIIFLFATHHFAYFLIPLVIIYLYLNLIKEPSPNFLKRINGHSIYLYAITLIIALMTPFFTRLFIEKGSRYVWVIDSFITLGRWIGPLVFFAVSGVIYVLLKKDKKLGDWYILLSLLVFAPMLYSQIYGKFLLIPLLCIFISMAFMNVVRLDTKNKKALGIFIILVLFAAFSFSSYFNHMRSSGSSSYWYMSDEIYSGGIWAKNYVAEGSRAIGPSSLVNPDSLDSRRFFAVSEGHFIIPTGGAIDLAYGLVNVSEIDYTKNSFLSLEFYFDAPFVSTSEQSLMGSTDWILEQRNVNDQKIANMLHDRNVSYIFEPAYQTYNIMPSVYDSKDRVYDSGSFRVHVVDKNEI